MGKKLQQSDLPLVINNLKLFEHLGIDHARKSVVRVLCHCDVEFTARYSNIKSGTTKSCGCWNIEAIKQRNTIHGLSHDPRFQVWVDMNKRCHNSRDRNYKNYGGRGIYVCDEWRDNPKQFFEDMGERPEGATLDRIDNNKNYCKENCRWTSMAVQQNNKRTNKHLTIGGMTKTYAEWAKHAGLKKKTVTTRISRGVTGEAVIAPTKK